jgi:predicted dehydrogenase
MNTPLRVGLLGAGGHARQILIPAIEQIPEKMILVALATAHEETARHAGEFYRLPHFVGSDSLIGYPGVDAVIIASNDHERHAIAALSAGKHVFSETPGITSVEGAARIRQLARDRGLIYQVGSCLRYAPVYVKLKRLFVEWREREPGPRTIGIRYFPYIGHFQNLLLYLAGPITRVMAIHHPDNSGAVSLYRFASGDMASITWAAFHNVSLAYESVEIIHPSGRLYAEDGRCLRFDRTPAERSVHPYALNFELAEAQLYNPNFSMPYGRNNQIYQRGYTPELEDFARCVREGDAPLCGVDDAEQTRLVGVAAGVSKERGGEWVDVDATA